MRKPKCPNADTAYILHKLETRGTFLNRNNYIEGAELVHAETKYNGQYSGISFGAIQQSRMILLGIGQGIIGDCHAGIRTNEGSVADSTLEIKMLKILQN